MSVDSRWSIFSTILGERERLEVAQRRRQEDDLRVRVIRQVVEERRDVLVRLEVQWRRVLGATACRPHRMAVARHLRRDAVHDAIEVALVEHFEDVTHGLAVRRGRECEVRTDMEDRTAADNIDVFHLNSICRHHRHDGPCCGTV